MTQYSLNHGVVVLTAPSGSGKTTIAREVERSFPNIRFSTSATTRPARENEQNGIHYHFISTEDFQKHIKAGDFLEYEEVYPGRFYGTLFSELIRMDKEGPVLLDIDVNGAMRVKKIAGDHAVIIFIRPPSLEELKHRLENRGTESEKWLLERMKRAAMEMQFAEKCDHVVLNDTLEDAVEETLSIVNQFLEAQKLRYERTRSIRE